MLTGTGAIGRLRAVLVDIDGPIAVAIPPGRHGLKGRIPQFQEVVEEGRADIRLGPTLVPLEIRQRPPPGLCLVRFALNGLEGHRSPVAVGDIFFFEHVVRRVFDSRPGQIENPGRGKVHQQTVKQGPCFRIDGLLLIPPFSKEQHELLQAFVFDNDMPQRWDVPAPAVRPVTRTDQGLEPVEIPAFLLHVKTRQERPQDPGWIVRLDIGYRLVKFKCIDLTVGADREQTPFVQVCDDVMLAFRQRRQGAGILIIRFQSA